VSITNRLFGRKRNRLWSRQNSRYAACSSRFHVEHHHYCCCHTATLRGGRRTVHCCGHHAASLRGARAGREWCRGLVAGPPWRGRRPRYPGVPALPDLATRKIFHDNTPKGAGLGIHDILVRIRIRGFVPLING